MVKERYGLEIKEINRSLRDHEQVKRFRLVTEEWSPQSGELSPTLKLRRDVVHARYRIMIDGIYSNGADREFTTPSKTVKGGINGILKNLPGF